MKWKRFALISLGFIIVGALICATTPVQISTEKGVSTQQIDEGQWEPIPLATPARVTIRNLTQSRASVKFPELRWPEVFNADLVTKMQRVREDVSQQRFSFSPGGILVLEGVISDIGIAPLAGGTGARLTVEAERPNGTTNGVVSAGSGALFQSPSVDYIRTTPFLWRTISSGKASEVGMSYAQIGDRVIRLQPGQQLSVAKALPAVASVFTSGLVAFAVALLGILIGWLSGRVIVGITGGRLSTIPTLLMGLGVTLCVLNTMSYLAPLRDGAVLWFAALAVGLVVQGSRNSGYLREVRAGAGDLARMASWVLLPVFLLFYPIFHLSTPWLGDFNTDVSAQYLHAAEMMGQHSLITLRDLPMAQNAGLIPAGLGFEWRSVDVALISLVSISTFRPDQGLEVAAILLLLVYGLSLLYLMERNSVSARLKAVVLLLLFYPLTLLLFLTGYWAHYVFVALLPGAVVALYLWTSTPGKGMRDKAPAALLAATMGALLLLAYPQFAVLAIGAFLATLLGAWLVRHRSSSDRQEPQGQDVNAHGGVGIALLTTASFILLLGLGARSVIGGLDPAMVGEFQERLNEILQFVLLSPYEWSQVTGLALGAVPYLWRYPWFDPQQFMGGVGWRGWELAGDAWQPGLLLIPITLVAVGGLIASVNWRVAKKDMTVIGVSVTMAVMVFGTVVLLVRGESYGGFKLGWTALCLVPVLIASFAYHRSRLTLLLVCMLPIAVLWIRTDLAERTLWSISNASAVSKYSHSSLQSELGEVRTSLEEVDPGKTLILQGGQPLAGSDRDVTALHQAVQIVRQQGRSCINCERYRPVEQCSRGVTEVISIGLVGEGEVCGLPLHYSGDIIEVFARERKDPD